MQIFVESNRIQIQLVIVHYKEISMCTNIINVNTNSGSFASFPHAHYKTSTKDAHTHTQKKTQGVVTLTHDFKRYMLNMG